MKKCNRLLILTTILLVFGLTGCNSNNEPGDTEPEYYVPVNEPELVVGLIETTNNQMYHLLNDTSGVGIFVYVGMSTCPFCHQFEPVLIETLEYLGRSVYHFEADTAALLDEDSIMTMFDILTSMIEQTNHEWGGHVPAMIYLVDGEVINFMIGAREMDEIIEFFEMDHFNDRTWNIVIEVDVARFDWLPEVGLTYLENQEFYDLLADRNYTGFFVYIGTPACPFCQQFEPILVETLEELGLGLRYWQIDDAFVVDEEFATEVFMIIFDQTQWNGGVPVIKFIANGHVLDFISGVQDSAAVIEFFERNGGLE